MPPHIKVILSLIVLLVVTGAHLFRDAIGLTASPLLLFGLALGMAVSLWLFPEPRRQKPARGSSRPARG